MILCRLVLVPLACEPHVVPPSPLWRMTPPFPTTQTSRSLTAATSEKLVVTPGVCANHPLEGGGPPVGETEIVTGTEVWVRPRSSVATAIRVKAPPSTLVHTKVKGARVL